MGCLSSKQHHDAFENVEDSVLVLKKTHDRKLKENPSKVKRDGDAYVKRAPFPSPPSGDQ
jgi:hypothetical protein